MSEFRKTLEILLVVGLVAWLAVTFTKPEDARIENAEAVAFTLATAYRGERGITDSVIADVDRKTRNLYITRRELSRIRDSLDTSLEAAREMLTDTLATTAQLRFTLGVVTERATALSAKTSQLSLAMDSVLASHDRERAQWLVERQSAISALAAKDSVIAAYQATQCTVLGVKCPSRKQVLVVGLLAGLFAR